MQKIRNPVCASFFEVANQAHSVPQFYFRFFSRLLLSLRSATDYVRLLLRTLEKPWNYRGRAVSVADIVFIRELIAAGPEIGRCSLSRLLCEAWGWKQPNGALCDMICRGLLLRLDRAGEIQLPAVRF